MSIAARKNNIPGVTQGEVDRLVALDSLATTDIESPFKVDLSRDLHSLFDPVSDDALPIYFGPLLGRLYLEGF